MSVIMGLTGPTGAGKSTVACAAEEKGVTVINCDAAAREAVVSGSDGLKALTAAFGDGILLPDGTLNRKKLAILAFADKEHTELLNRVLLPHIVKIVKAKMHGDFVLLDAPTLFESGLDKICNVTVAVLSDRETRLKRIIARDKISEADALLRMSAGKPDSFYLERADYIIYNNAAPQKCISEAARLFEKIFVKESADKCQ